MKHETPIQRLSIQVNSNTLYMKRDDLGLFSFGGNKLRKALPFFEDMKQAAATTVVTYGSSSSNHCRVVAHEAKSHGLRCVVIAPEEDLKVTFNRQMVLESGAGIVTCPVDAVSTTIAKTLSELKQAGERPYFIPGGGHGLLGTQAYVEAFEEILAFEDRTGVVFDAVYLASGTGATQAGLVAGSVLHETRHAIHGISIARRKAQGAPIVLESVNELLAARGVPALKADALSFLDDYILGGYGDANAAIHGWIRRMLHEEGIPMDSTYTGKAFWGMVEHLEECGISGRNILFLHTGGTPLFFDDLLRRKEEIR